MSKSILSYNLILFTILLCFSCNVSQTFNFNTPVDTKTKDIEKSSRRNFEFPSMDIYVTNDFDGANLNDVKAINDSTIITYITPENTPINDSPYYSFKLWSDKPKTIEVLFKYPEKNKHRYNPKIKKSNSTWHPLDSIHITQKDSTTSIKLNINKDTTWVSAQEVITSKDTQNWIKELRANKPFIHLNSAGKTKLDRNIPVLDIYLDHKENKEIIVLLTRQHPPEVTGYMAFQEFLSTLVKEDSLSLQFLEKYRIIAFPILNPDGVDLGHWRHNAGGIDLNRDWSHYRQPEIKQTVKYLSKQIKKDNSKIILGMDFHSTWYDVFYTNKTRTNTSMPTYLDQWFTALENNIPDYKVNEKASDSERPVSKAWFLLAHNAVGITYEIGDETPRDRIEQISKISAEQMMRLMVNRK